MRRLPLDGLKFGREFIEKGTSRDDAGDLVRASSRSPTTCTQSSPKDVENTDQLAFLPARL